MQHLYDMSVCLLPYGQSGRVPWHDRIIRWFEHHNVRHLTWPFDETGMIQIDVESTL